MNPTQLKLLAALFSENVQPTITETTSDGTIYIGYPLPSCTGVDDPRWLIKRVKTMLDTNSGSETQTIQYANGIRAYNQKWSDRATLTYKHNAISKE